MKLIDQVAMIKSMMGAKKLHFLGHSFIDSRYVYAYLMDAPVICDTENCKRMAENADKNVNSSGNS